MGSALPITEGDGFGEAEAKGEKGRGFFSSPSPSSIGLASQDRSTKEMGFSAPLSEQESSPSDYSPSVNSGMEGSRILSPSTTVVDPSGAKRDSSVQKSFFLFPP